MQTIIQLVESYTNDENVVFYVSNLKDVESDLFSEDELSYMKAQQKENKKDFFAFNRLNNWVFVSLFEKNQDKSLNLENCRDKGAQFQAFLNDQKLNSIVIADTGQNPFEALAFSEGLVLKNYQFLKYKSKPEEILNSLSTVLIFSEGLDQQEVDFQNIVVDATYRCRNLVNEPVATLNAVALASEIEKMANESGCKAEILNRKKIESLKMGGLLAVNQGSVDPPTFSIMEWKPSKAINKKPVIFVGKGVVYDTGGMNIKTGNFMNDMKMDMAGGAVAASALYAIAKAKLPVHVIALVPATDNRTHGNAYVNGDIITMYDGTRVEVINTDAEGRMLLADALAYAKQYDPELVIDIATLTGSALRAIGTYGIVAMQHDAGKSFKELETSGKEVYERLVEFPMWKEYREDLKSDIADIKHMGGVNGGSITAAKFLEHFTDYPYIHLDIAGPAFFEKGKKYLPTGATGTGVRLLFNFIKSKLD